MRTLLTNIEHKFLSLHERSLDLLRKSENARSGWDAADHAEFRYHIIRSAAEVERIFGGITSRLWDDPFEWTLPEELDDPLAIENYLNEVRETSIRGLSFLSDDTALSKVIAAPEGMRTIFSVLLEGVCKAENHLGAASRIRARHTADGR